MRDVQRVWKKSYLRKSRFGCAEWTAQKLLAITLKMLKTVTRNAADHLALKPTATMTHATKPRSETNALPILH